jgi:hypothetical protein
VADPEEGRRGRYRAQNTLLTHRATQVRSPREEVTPLHLHVWSIWATHESYNGAPWAVHLAYLRLHWAGAKELVLLRKESSHGATEKWASSGGWAARSPWCPLYRVPRGQGEAHCIVHMHCSWVWLLGSCHTITCISTVPSSVLCTASWSRACPIDVCLWSAWSSSSSCCLHATSLILLLRIRLTRRYGVCWSEPRGVPRLA